MMFLQVGNCCRLQQMLKKYFQAESDGNQTADSLDFILKKVPEPFADQRHPSQARLL
jgi:hypothetical protein